jgi:hypothetical protein
MKAVRLFSLALVTALFVGCGRGTTIPSTPDGTVSKVAEEIANDKPQVVWHALPAKYQEDVNEVISDFADKMDPEIWDKTFTVLGKVTKIAEEKKEFILGALSENRPPQLDQEKLDQLDEQWDQVVALFDDLVNSDIKTVSGLKKLDPEDFLATTGSKLSKNIKDLAAAVGDEETAAKIESLEEVKTTVVKSDADKATVKVEVKGESPTEVEMVKVEGKWLPADMVANWDTGIARMKQSISEMDFSGESKQQYLAMLGQVEEVLDAMLAAESQKEFTEAAKGIMGMVPMMGGAGPPPGFAEPPPGFAEPPMEFPNLPTDPDKESAPDKESIPDKE